MWCPACGTEMVLPENICPACQRQVPLGGGDFLSGISAPVDPPQDMPKDTPETAAASRCPDKPEPNPESDSPNPRGFFQQCRAEFHGLLRRLTRKDDAEL